MHALAQIDLLACKDRLTLSHDAASGETLVLDPIRRMRVHLTPEELVRQLWIRYLLDECAIPRHRMAVERGLNLKTGFRFDLIVVDSHLQPYLLAEFKAPDIPLAQDVFDQVAVYHSRLCIPYALVSNGHRHYCFRFDDRHRTFDFQENLRLP